MKNTSKKMGRPNSPEPMKMVQISVPLRLWNDVKVAVKKFVKENKL